MLSLVLCNFLMQFGKLFFEKFANFFSVLAQNIALVVITAATATPKFVGEAGL